MPQPLTFDRCALELLAAMRSNPIGLNVTNAEAVRLSIDLAEELMKQLQERERNQTDEFVANL